MYELLRVCWGLKLQGSKPVVWVQNQLQLTEISWSESSCALGLIGQCGEHGCKSTVGKNMTSPLNQQARNSAHHLVENQGSPVVCRNPRDCAAVSELQAWQMLGHRNCQLLPLMARSMPAATGWTAGPLQLREATTDLLEARLIATC